MKYFKEGQIVYDVRFGRGVVCDDNLSPYNNEPRVLVNFGDHKVVYLFDGRLSSTDKYSILSHEPWPQTILKPIVEFEEGELVWVKWNNSYTTWEVRYYSHTDNKGVHYCYIDQKKDGSATPWKYCRKFEDNPLLEK